MKRERDDTTEGQTIDNAELRAMVREIVASRMTPKMKEIEFQKRYPAFAEGFPMLFAMACQPHFDNARFEYMLKLREQISNEQRSVDNASKEVGEKLFKEYVAPVVRTTKPDKKPSSSSSN